MSTTRSLLASLLISSGAMIALPSAAQDMEAALQAMDAALPGEFLHNPLDIQWDSGGNDIKTKIVDAAALPSGQAVSARIKKRQDRPWDSHLSIQIDEAVSKGEEVQVYFWVRTDKAAKGKDTAHISLFFGRNDEPYDYIVSEEIMPSTEWKLENVKGVADANFPAGSLKLEYQLGRAKQTVEFGPAYVSTLGMADGEG